MECNLALQRNSIAGGIVSQEFGTVTAYMLCIHLLSVFQVSSFVTYLEGVRECFPPGL